MGQRDYHAQAGSGTATFSQMNALHKEEQRFNLAFAVQISQS